MSFTGKYIPVDRIIENVYNDHPFESSVEWDNCLEWVGSAMRLMGVPTIMVKDIKCVIIEDYKGELPDGILNIDMIRFKSSSTDPDTTSIAYKAMRYEGSPFIIKEFCTSGDSIKNLCNQSSDLTYRLNNNYIFTSFEKGQIEISYDKFPIDDRGFPLIPDDEGIIQGMSWFIAYKIAYSLWMSDQLSKIKFDFIRQEKDWYIGKAISRARAMSKDRLETWKNMTVRLLPKLNAHSSQFSGLGGGEKLHNHNNNPYQGDVNH